MEKFTENVFETSVAFVYRETEGKLTGIMVEHQLSTLYLADNEIEALQSAKVWANNRFESLFKNHPHYPESSIGSVKIHPYRIAKLDDKGNTQTRRGWCLFEWKMDRGTTLEQEIEIAVGKIKAIELKKKLGH